MKTGKNIATNNYVLRLWSTHYYEGSKGTLRENIYVGTLQNVKTLNVGHFDNAAQLLSLIQKMNREDERIRRESKALTKEERDKQ